MIIFNDDDTTANQVLSQDNISAEMNSAVTELEHLLPISSEQRQLLLLKFNWDIASLKNSFQEYTDINSFLLENGICPENTVSVIKKSECAICCAAKRLLGLRCQHMACSSCWSKYLTTKIRDDRCILLGCIELGCGMLISNEMLGKFLDCSKLETAHRRLIDDSYINSDSSLAWCKVKCGMAVRRLNNDTVICSCGSTFCFLCKSDAHYPATCLQVRIWKQQRMDLGQKTLSLILLNTRDCPRCFIPIQKIGGCDNMTCTGCRFQYCWVCRQNWKTHSGRCKQSDYTVTPSRLNNKGYLHLFAPYVANIEYHKKCLKQDPRGLTEFKIQNTLDECRRILMGSYVFGYYLKDGEHKYILGMHQQNLETVVKELALSKTGRRASKLAEECRTLRQTLLTHCAEGAEHENLDERQPVGSVTTVKDDADNFCDTIFVGICYIIAMGIFCFLVTFVRSSRKNVM